MASFGDFLHSQYTEVLESLTAKGLVHKPTSKDLFISPAVVASLEQMTHVLGKRITERASLFAEFRHAPLLEETKKRKHTHVIDMRPDDFEKGWQSLQQDK